MEQDLAQTVTDIPARIQSGIHQQNAKLTWTKGDRVSVFNGTTGNERWRFVGETGSTEGTLSRMNGEPSQTPFGGVVAIYPYNFHNRLTDDGKLCIEIPKTQSYSANPSDMGMAVAFGDNTGLVFHNIMSYVEIRLTGDATIKKIELRGNNGERLAGRVQIAKDLSVVFADDGCETITLDCGDGVALSNTPTSFYIGLLTGDFAKGLTITICDSEGKVMYHQITKPINLHQTEYLANLRYADKIPSNCIWYTSSIGKIENPHDSSKFNANIISNTYENGKGVIRFDKELTTIGDHAFAGIVPRVAYPRLRDLTIPDRVVEIGDSAFQYCTSLTSISLSNSVTKIGNCAFKGCSGLNSVYITDIVAWCNIKFGSSNGNPLYYANNLYLNDELVIDLVVPDGVTAIGEYTFSGCTSLTSITIPNSVTTIGDSAFVRCTELNSFYGKYASEDNRCLVIDGKLIAFAPAGLTEYNIPSIVTSIGESVFENCTRLRSITIPDSVTEIGRCAFSGCTGELIINCKKIYGVQIRHSLESIFAEATFTKVICGNNVTEIGDGAFKYCKSLTGITIPDSVTTIGDSAFFGCTGLTSITIPDSVTKIGNSAFWGCTGLTSIAIPDSVTKIGRSAFFGCTGLTSIIIPDSITEIDSSTFLGCTSLMSITIPDSITAIGSSAFKDCRGLTSISIPDSVTEIDNDAFKNCSYIISITTGNGVTSIDWITQMDCAGLQCINIGNRVKTIGASAFRLYDSLIDITIGNSVTKIGDSAFSYCKKLTNIVIPDSVEEIESCAFCDCIELTIATIGRGVKKIGDSAFRDCTSLKNITIPDRITTIGNSAFDGCTSLTSITIPDSITAIGCNVFNGCTGLTSVKIGNCVTTIGISVFEGCTGLTSITIPDSVTTIGSSAFKDCRGLTNITIPDSVTKIGNYAFDGCLGLKSVNINGDTSIGEAAFRGCINLVLYTKGIPTPYNSLDTYYVQEDLYDLYDDYNYEDDEDHEFDSYVALGGDPEKYRKGCLDDYMDGIGL